MAATLPWIKVDTDIAEHPKTKRLGFRLKVRRAHRFIVDLWLWCGKCAPTGRIAGPDAELVLEDAAGWEGDPGAFAQAAIDLGLVDRDGDDLWVHDWDEHNRAHIRKVLSDRLRTARSRAKARVLKQSGDVATEEVMEALVEQDKAVLAAKRALDDFDLSSDGRETVEGESRDHRETVEGEREKENEKKQETTHTLAREPSSTPQPAQDVGQSQPQRPPQPPLVGLEAPPGTEATRPAHGQAPKPVAAPRATEAAKRYPESTLPRVREKWLALKARCPAIADWDEDLVDGPTWMLWDADAQALPLEGARGWDGVMDAIAASPWASGGGANPTWLFARQPPGKPSVPKRLLAGDYRDVVKPPRSGGTGPPKRGGGAWAPAVKFDPQTQHADEDGNVPI